MGKLFAGDASTKEGNSGEWLQTNLPNELFQHVVRDRRTNIREDNSFRRSDQPSNAYVNPFYDYCFVLTR